MLGLTVIYVPPKNREFTEKGSADKELVKRLEGVVACWNTQIKIALSDQKQASPPDELLSLDDEYEFSIYRCKCLLLRKDVVLREKKREDSIVSR